MTSFPAHHIANITSHGGVREISLETQALALFNSGKGYEDIAAHLFGKATEETAAKARKLVQDGRAKALGAH